MKADGTFECPAVLPGSYRVTSGAQNGWWLRSAITGGRDVLDGGLTIGVDVADLVLTLTDRHSGIAGSLSGTGGRPATEYFLIAFPANRAQWRAPSRRVMTARAATDGAFELRDLPAGSYYLAAVTDLEPSDLEDPAFLESLIPSAATVTLGEGERKVQNLRIAGSRGQWQ